MFTAIIRSFFIVVCNAVFLFCSTVWISLYIYVHNTCLYSFSFGIYWIPIVFSLSCHTVFIRHVMSFVKQNTYTHSFNIQENILFCFWLIIFSWYCWKNANDKATAIHVTFFHERFLYLSLSLSQLFIFFIRCHFIATKSKFSSYRNSSKWCVFCVYIFFFRFVFEWKWRSINFTKKRQRWNAHWRFCRSHLIFYHV